ncbi:MAG: L,D-transpeptidase [Cyanobacteriota bacterium]
MVWVRCGARLRPGGWRALVAPPLMGVLAGVAINPVAAGVAATPLPKPGGAPLPLPVPVPVAEVLVDLSEQRLSAFDADHRLLYRRLVSTGVAASPTPVGRFTVRSRYAATPMTGRDYQIPSVPHVLCLGGGGLPADAICIHPAPWQEAAGQPFGVPRSHGCVRTSSSTARWLFERTAVGTPVTIQP